MVIFAAVSAVLIHRSVTEKGELFDGPNDPAQPARPDQGAVSESAVPAQNANANAHGRTATLFIIANDPAVQLTIKQKGETVIDRTAKREIELQPGEYEIELA
jgi:hypothetical protein